MLLKTITLGNFRSFSRASFDFSPQTTVIVGPNGAGKTNIIESVYCVATGKSFRAGREQEMIRDGSELARVNASIGLGGEVKQLEVVLMRREGTRIGKKLTINKLARRLIDYQGTLSVVLFGPWDMNLVVDSPSVRRKFLDLILCQVDREYRRCLMSYERGLRQRNRLLLRIRDHGASRSQLAFWDQLLIKNGDYLGRQRARLIDFINGTPQLAGESFHLTYDKSGISKARLAQYQREEVVTATTLVGPHRDDIVFQIRNYKLEIRNLAIYGSRGEQRMCILWAKLAQLAYVEQIAGRRPLLLLDDIFSELDHQHRTVVGAIVDRQQTIVTTADPHTVPANHLAKIALKEQ